MWGATICESRFALNQAKLIEQQTDYETMLNSAYSGAMLKAGGYPKKDMTKFKIVVDGGVKDHKGSYLFSDD